MGSLSLRKLWAEAPWAPDHGTSVDVWTRVPDPPVPKKIVGSFGDEYPAEGFGSRSPWGHLEHTAKLGEDTGRRLRPLSEGVRGSSQAFRTEPSGETVRIVPFTLRTILSSFTWPESYALSLVQGEEDPPAGPHGDWTEEVQGIAVSSTTTYLTTTEAVWKVALMADDESEGHETGPAPESLSPIDEEIVATLGEEPPRAIVSMIWREGLFFTGRKYAVEGHPPAHMSTPCFSGGRLFVPAEGTRKIPPLASPFWEPRPQNVVEHRKWLTNMTRDPSVTYQTLYIVDPSTLGYLGRIGLPVLEVPDGLGNFFATCFIDERSGTILASVAAQNPADYPMNELYLYRLPDLATLPERGSVFSITETPVIQHFYPTYIADYLGRLPLSEGDKRVRFRGVNGIVFTRDHLYVNHHYVNKPRGGGGDDDKGLTGFDLMTGRQVRYFSLDDVDGDLQGMAPDHDGSILAVSDTGVRSRSGFLVYRISEAY